jgi:hypothetical protein
MVQLPTEKSQPKTSLTDLVVLLYGVPKIGKSTFAASAEDALFIETEPGLEHLSVYKVACYNWSDFCQIGKLLAEGDHPFKTVVIDTVDNLYKWCVESVLRRNEIQHLSDLSFSKGWDLASQSFHRKLHQLALLPYGLIMISHAGEKEVDGRRGKIRKIVPTLDKRGREIVTNLADLVLFAELEEQRDEETGDILGFRPVVRTKPTTLYEAGDRTGRLPDTLPLDYQVITRAYLEAGTKQPATDELRPPVERPVSLPRDRSTSACGRTRRTGRRTETDAKDASKETEQERTD